MWEICSLWPRPHSVIVVELLGSLSNKTLHLLVHLVSLFYLMFSLQWLVFLLACCLSLTLLQSLLSLLSSLFLHPMVSL